MSHLTQTIQSIDQLETNKVYIISGGYRCENMKPHKVRCLGNYGPPGKVYFTKEDSNETPESMADKFSRNRMPNCFCCWDSMINQTYFITEQ